MTKQRGGTKAAAGSRPKEQSQCTTHHSLTTIHFIVTFPIMKISKKSISLAN
jgi:hypothetical protein